MLKLERKDVTTFTLVSDDANAENATLDEAIEGHMPQLHGQFEDTTVDGDGLLRFDVAREHWEDFLDVVDWLATGAEIPVPGAEKMYEEVRKAQQEVPLEQGATDGE